MLRHDRVERLVRLRLEESARLKQRLATLHVAEVAAAAAAFADTIERGGTVLLCGNGGSAADAQHLAAELTGRFVHDRRALPGIALTTDSSALTAIANDYGYEHVFERQVRALGRPGDLLVAISTSGRSASVLLAVEAARAGGLRTLGLTGGDGGDLASAADLVVVVPSTATARIQEAHITVGHIACEVVEQRLFDRTDAGIGSGAGPVETSAGVVSLEELLRLRARWRERGDSVVWTGGCFDLLHVGHVRSLRAARSLGDVLVVGLNDDASVRRLKGPGRPLVPFAERAELLTALSCVDAVVGFAEDTPVAMLDRLQPDVACKGADYADRPLPERAVVEAHGGRMELLPLVPGRSSTALRRALGEVEAIDA